MKNIVEEVRVEISGSGTNAYDNLLAENAQLKQILRDLLPAFWNDNATAKHLRMVYEDQIADAESALRGEGGGGMTKACKATTANLVGNST